MVKPRELGHVNIRVRDLERAEKFYTEVLGLTVTHRREAIVFMSAKPGHHSHEIAIRAMSPNALTADPKRVGTNHFAWRMNSFEDLQEIYWRLKEKGVEISNMRGNTFSMGIYFEDPDGNGNEAYYETDDAAWLRGSWEGECPWKLEEAPARR